MKVNLVLSSHKLWDSTQNLQQENLEKGGLKVLGFSIVGVILKKKYIISRFGLKVIMMLTWPS